jgi:hypothetical protein
MALAVGGLLPVALVMESGAALSQTLAPRGHGLELAVQVLERRFHHVGVPL